MILLNCEMRNIPRLPENGFELFQGLLTIYRNMTNLATTCIRANQVVTVRDHVPKLLEAVEKTFDWISPWILLFVMRKRLLAVLFDRHYGFPIWSLVAGQHELDASAVVGADNVQFGGETAPGVAEDLGLQSPFLRPRQHADARA